MKGEGLRLRVKLNGRHIVLALFVMIIALGSALRFYCLGCKSLWNDEVASIKRSEEYSITELSQMFFRRLPPLYNIVLRLFLYLGNNEFVVRLPSVIFGLLSIVLIYKLGTLFFGRREGLISAFLLSISTMHIRYSQEARMYSLAMFLALLSFYFFYKALKEGDIKLWIGFTVSTLLGIFTHYYLLFVPLIEMPLFVFILFKNRGSLMTRIQKVGRKKLFFLVLSFAIIIALAFPALQAASISILRSFETGLAFDVPWGIKPIPSFFIILFDCFNTGGFLRGALEVWSEPIFYTFLLILLLGLIASAREYRKPVTLLLLWVFLPTIMLFILSLVLDRPITHPKYMLFVLPGYLIGVSKGVGCVADHLAKRLRFSSIAPPKRNHVISLALVIGVFAGSAVLPLKQYYESEKPNWRATGEYFEAYASPSDVILVEPSYTMKDLLYYYDPDSEGTFATTFDHSLMDIAELSARNLLKAGRIKIYNVIDTERLGEGKIYEASAWYKGDIPSTFYITLHNAKWEVLNITITSVHTTSEWKKVTLTTEPIPSGVVHASLCFSGKAVGYFLVDDCTMFEQTHSEINILSNGGFEDGLMYWEFEQIGLNRGHLDLSTDARTGQHSGQLTVTVRTDDSSIYARSIFLVYSKWHSSLFDPEGENKDWLYNNFMEAKIFKPSIVIYHRPEDLILVFTENMQFVGLDSPPNEPVAKFYDNNDSASFEVSISKNANYTIAIHAKSPIKSSVDLLIDGVSQGSRTFAADDWCYVELGMFYQESGPHEIKLVVHACNNQSDPTVILDAAAVYASS